MAKKKLVISIIIFIVVVLVFSGAMFVFAKDLVIFDVFYSGQEKEIRIIKRMAKLFPEKLEDFSLYSRGPEKISGDPEECEEVNETLNKENLEIKGTVCARSARGQYRNAENKVVFVHMMRITKGADIPGLDYLFGKIAGVFKLGSYEIVRPERHEIGWFPINKDKMDVILTQEGVARLESDGGESMLYQNQATGDNPVTKYFIEKYQPKIVE